MREKLTRAIRNPSKISPFLQRQFRNGYHRHFRNREAAIYDDRPATGVPNRANQGIKETLFGDIEMSAHAERNFRTFLEVSDYAHYFGCESILEIGAGYSTAIWAEYSDRTGADVSSVDADVETIPRKLGGTRHEQSVRSRVDLIEGVSVHPGEIAEFYRRPTDEIAGVELDRFVEEIDLLGRADGCPAEYANTVNRLAATKDWSIRDLLVSDGQLFFPSEVLDQYVVENDFDEHLSSLRDVETTGVLDELVDSNGSWDLIWFDSGETSSIVEWTKLKECINPGGLAAFHDVFFPKSMKNFLVVSSLFADPDWEILTIDDSTVQGLAVAQRRAESIATN